MLKYEIVQTNGNKVIAQVWWDGKKIGCTSTRFLESLKEENIMGVTFDDGEEFVKNLPQLYKNGYMHARKVNS